MTIPGSRVTMLRFQEYSISRYLNWNPDLAFSVCKTLRCREVFRFIYGGQAWEHRHPACLTMRKNGYMKPSAPRHAARVRLTLSIDSCSKRELFLWWTMFAAEETLPEAATHSSHASRQLSMQDSWHYASIDFRREERQRSERGDKTTATARTCRSFGKTRQQLEDCARTGNTRW